MLLICEMEDQEAEMESNEAETAICAHHDLNRRLVTWVEEMVLKCDGDKVPAVTSSDRHIYIQMVRERKSIIKCQLEQSPPAQSQTVNSQPSDSIPAPAPHVTASRNHPLPPDASASNYSSHNLPSNNESAQQEIAAASETAQAATLIPSRSPSVRAKSPSPPAPSTEVQIVGERLTSPAKADGASLSIEEPAQPAHTNPAVEKPLLESTTANERNTITSSAETGINQDSPIDFKSLLDSLDYRWVVILNRRKKGDKWHMLVELYEAMFEATIKPAGLASRYHYMKHKYPWLADYMGETVSSRKECSPPSEQATAGETLPESGKIGLPSTSLEATPSTIRSPSDFRARAVSCSEELAGSELEECVQSKLTTRGKTADKGSGQRTQPASSFDDVSASHVTPIRIVIENGTAAPSKASSPSGRASKRQKRSHGSDKHNAIHVDKSDHATIDGNEETSETATSRPSGGRGVASFDEAAADRTKFQDYLSKLPPPWKFVALRRKQKTTWREITALCNSFYDTEDSEAAMRKRWFDLRQKETWLEEYLADGDGNSPAD
ncbi:hypothetical protein NQ176_g2115 [Zarea fungicola]|uniref:Uncharacterized protein n=1 Tax=Zarea fungicola TaxID=93591 RepID=A0ACC1NQC4_9HYPO|nr:hypothetical protein NQ176_g2115 [Lecanicillium fungicola]